MPEALLKLADCPPASVTAATTVRAAVDVMRDARVGAVVVLEGERVAGIFTERDVMLRVVGAGLDPLTTTVSSVMVSNPVSVTPAARRAEALELMLTNHFRHLPITDDAGKAIGMLSIRNVLANRVERLEGHMASLEQYILADGPGG